MRSWLRRVIYHPGSLMKMSGIFLLCSLPLLSIGWAWGIVLTLARRSAEERKLQCFATIRGALSKQGLKFFLLGLFDLCFALLLLASVFFLLFGEAGLLQKAGSAFFIWIDLMILCSGMYRYTLAVYNEDLPLREILVRGLLMTFSRPGQTVLFILVFLSVLLITGLTGLALFLFAPGIIAFLYVEVYQARVREALRNCG
jgi:uncharacterized membrane protein YesL